MPKTRLTDLIRTAFTDWGVFGPVPTASARTGQLVARVSGRFDVSNDAARVRLLQLGYLKDGVGSASLDLQ